MTVTKPEGEWHPKKAAVGGPRCFTWSLRMSAEGAALEAPQEQQEDWADTMTQECTQGPSWAARTP